MNSEYVGEGSIALQFLETIPWPPVEPMTLSLDTATQGEQCRISCAEDARINIEICYEGQTKFKLRSPILERRTPRPIKFAFRWGGGTASLAIGGKIVEATDDPNLPLETFEVPDREWQPDKTVEKNIEDEKIELIRRRNSNYEIGWHSNKNIRTLEDNEYALLEAAQSLWKLALETNQGIASHYFAIAAMIRMLACRGRNMDPLLQRVAGIKKRELRIFAHPPDINSKLDHIMKANFADY